MRIQYSAESCARFFARVGPDGKWMGEKGRGGYGRFTVNGRRVRAHRFAWELSTGYQVPWGWCVLHTCDEPPCVNPAHLFLGNHGDNIRDRNRKGRHKPSDGRPNWTAKLTANQVRELRTLHSAGDVSYRQLARRFGIDVNTAWMAINRKTWPEVA
jgi:hypothetical protein